MVYEAKDGFVMAKPLKNLRFSLKAGICLFFICAVIFVSWAYSQKKYAYEKADALLQRRKQKIISNNMWWQREIEFYMDELKAEALSAVFWDDFLSDYESYTFEENRNGKVISITSIPDYIEGDEGSSDTPDADSLPDGSDEEYLDDDGNPIFYGDSDEETGENSGFYIIEQDVGSYSGLIFDSDSGIVSSVYYTDEDEDTCAVCDLEKNGYEYREALDFKNDSALLYTYGPPLPQNELSLTNDTLMQAVKEIDLMHETEGEYRGYRYSVFFVQAMAYVAHDSFDEEAYANILDFYDVEKAKSQILSADGSLEYRVIHVIIFEDTEPFLRQWRLDMLKNGVALLLLLGIVVLTLFLYEKNNEKMLRLEKEAEEEKPVEEEQASPVPEMPYEKSVSEETARLLIANISLAEQSMGPNPYLDRLREEIENRSGKKEEAEENDE